MLTCPTTLSSNCESIIIAWIHSSFYQSITLSIVSGTVYIQTWHTGTKRKKKLNCHMCYFLVHCSIITTSVLIKPQGTQLCFFFRADLNLLSCLRNNDPTDLWVIINYYANPSLAVNPPQNSHMQADELHVKVKKQNRTTK